MLKTKYQTREEWLQDRQGKITGTKAGDVGIKRGGARKKGFYELIAEGVAIPDEVGVPLDPKDRGTYLEPIAIQKFCEATGKKVTRELVIWQREECPSIAVSPDGVVDDTYETESVECKCLSSASHLEAWHTKKIPSDYEEQFLQPFVVNDNLEKLYFVFYDPRIPAKSLFWYEIKRENYREQIREALEMQLQTVAEIQTIINELTY